VVVVVVGGRLGYLPGGIMEVCLMALGIVD